MDLGLFPELTAALLTFGLGRGIAQDFYLYQ